MSKSKLTPKAIFILLLAGALVVLSVTPARELYKQFQEVKKLEKELASLRQQNEKLKEEVERLKTDAYIEQQARARLGLVKPGEQAYVIVPPKQSAKEGRAKEEARKKALKKAAKPQTWWERVITFFEGLLP